MTEHWIAAKDHKSAGSTGPAETRGRTSGPAPELSVIVPVSGPLEEAAGILAAYRTEFDAMPVAYEMICIVDETDGIAERAKTIAADWPQVRFVYLHPWPGEDAVLAAGVDRARGKRIMTLPAWLEFDPSDLRKLVEIDDGSDLIVGCRPRENPSAFQRVRRGGLHWLVQKLFGHSFSDLFCRARIGRSEVFKEAAQHGLRQHFIPLVAVNQGFKVREMELAAPAESEALPTTGIYRFKPIGHVTALLDVLSLYVTLKFLKKPLRFFGFIGLPILGTGLLLTASLILARLAGLIALADRPMLIFGVLMIVLGIQIIAIGLIGEIIIFASGRRAKTYEVGEIVEDGGISKTPPATA